MCSPKSLLLAVVLLTSTELALLSGKGLADGQDQQAIQDSDQVVNSQQDD